MASSEEVTRLQYNGKEIVLVGTAHVSQASVDLVRATIAAERPDTVCVELCEARYQSLTQPQQWQETDLVRAIREKRAPLLLSNLLLASFQKRIGDKLGVRPGAEILAAVEAAGTIGAEIRVADRNIRTTLVRAWRMLGLWRKIKLMGQVAFSLTDMEEVDEAEIEKLKNRDLLDALLDEMGTSLPELRRVLIDERDRYLLSNIRSAPGSKIVAVVGAGHVPGILRHWNADVDLAELDTLPPKGSFMKIFRWALPAAIVALIVWGFVAAGAPAGTAMIKYWVVANAILAGLGALIALAHPLSILSAVVASPLTSLNPMLAAGWVSGLTEVLLRKPKVGDFEKLPLDIASIRGFWRNKITRVLLVVVFTNIGSSLGTFIAIPLMAKVFA